MKYAIFLLSCCAFKTVFGVDPEVKPVETPFVKELGDLHHKYTTEMEAIVSKFRDDAEELIASTQPKNTQVDQCMSEYVELERNHQAKIHLCGSCYRDALVHGNIEMAKHCYIRHFLKLNDDAIARKREIRKCIFAILNKKADESTMKPASTAGPSNKSTSNKSTSKNTKVYRPKKM